MKKITKFEMTCLYGGNDISSCKDVVEMGNSHEVPDDPSPDQQAAEDKFWANWLDLFDLFCR